MKRILIADDSATFLTTCLNAFNKSDEEFVFDTAMTPEHCFQKLKKRMFDLLVLDITFEGSSVDGFSMIADLKCQYPGMPILMISNDSSADAMYKSRFLGAEGYVSKSRNSLADIFSKLNRLLENEAKDEIYLEKGRELAAKSKTVFASRKMAIVFKTVAKVYSHRKIPVLIYGESGVGKDKVSLSFRQDNKPFVSINCGAISDSLAESLFFGAVRGSYTDAKVDTKGYFEQADGGVLFLDEVARLSPRGQGALLRALENSEIQKVGSQTVMTVDVRTVASTNEDLKKMVEAGTFREDLLSRLEGCTIEVPPLRERQEDILPLCEGFLNEFGYSHVTLCEDLKFFLTNLRWVKNIRELKHCVRMMTVELMPDQDLLTMMEFPRQFLQLPDKNSDILISIPISSDFASAQKLLMTAMVEYYRQKLGDGATLLKIADHIGVAKNTIYSYLKP